MYPLYRLWRGELPLVRAFWGCAVVGALIVNATTTLAFMLLIMAGWPVAALLAGYVISVPFNFVAAVGVWRSSKSYTGDPKWPTLARAASVLGLSVLSLTP